MGLKNNKDKLLIWGYIILSAVSAYVLPLIKFRKVIFARDWSPFNMYSHFIKSCILHYKTLPLHNPYILGGLDLFADPQSKAFSPLVILDILFTAPYANLISLVVLSVIGGYGVYKLLKYLKIDDTITFLIVFMFQHASWFILHATEGHIIFGSFQLTGLVMYFTLRLYEPKYKIYLPVVLAFMVLDGGMYAFIFSCLMIFFSYLFRLEGLSFTKLVKSMLIQWKASLFGIIIFILLFCAKIVPLMLLHRNRNPVLENIQLDAKSILAAFFYPFQYRTLRINGASYVKDSLGFHEIGAYIGVVSFILILWYLIKKYNKRYTSWIIFIVIFLWTGSGIGLKFNPWFLFQHIPVINNAHIQTRVLYLVFFGLLVLLAFSLNYFKTYIRKKIWFFLVIFLFTESFAISYLGWYKMYQDEPTVHKTDVFKTLLKNTKVEKTIKDAGYWGLNDDLLLKKNTACKGFMCPAVIQGDIKFVGDLGYRGEIYFLEGSGTLRELEYTPEKLVIYIKTNGPAEIQVNTNFLWRWTVNSSVVKLYDKNGLLTLSVPGSVNETLTLKYRPKYIYLTIPLYIFGLIMLLIYLFSKTFRVFINGFDEEHYTLPNKKLIEDKI